MSGALVRMNVYELELDSDDLTYQFNAHVRGESPDDAIARAVKQWGRMVKRVTFRRACKPWEVMEQYRRDQAPPADPSDVKIVASFGG